MTDSDNDNLDIYIIDHVDNIDDELITYLKEKRIDKKVSLFFI